MLAARLLGNTAMCCALLAMTLCPTTARAQEGACGADRDKFVLFGDRAWDVDALPVAVWVDSAGIGSIGGPTVAAATRRAAAAWNDVTCDRPFFVVAGVFADAASVDGGPVRVIVTSGPGAVDPQGRTVLAFTRVGEADDGAFDVVEIVVNADVSWTLDGCGGAADLQGVLTHELGHALGLSHSDDPRSVMRGVIETAETWTYRTLYPDDLAALDARYPSLGQCAPAPVDAGGCAACAGDGACPGGGACVVSPSGMPICAQPCGGIDPCAAGFACEAVAESGSRCVHACVPVADMCPVDAPVPAPEPEGCAAAGRATAAGYWALALAIAACRRRSGAHHSAVTGEPD